MSGQKLVIYAAMAANLLIAATKFVAAWWTGSSAIFSEGIHSVVDTADQLLLLYGLHRAAQPADEKYPFGHGKELYFWSFVVAILIFSLGAGVSLYEGVIHLHNPSAVKHPHVNYVVILLALVFEGVSWTISVREFRKRKKATHTFLQAIHKGKDPTVFLVVMEDSAAIIGLAAALMGVFLTDVTGIAIFDGAASVVIAAILATTAVILARETKSLLVGEAASVDVIDAIREIVAGAKVVEHVNEVLTLQMGPEYILATVSLDFTDTASAYDVENAIMAMEEAIVQKVPTVRKVFIETKAWSRRNHRRKD